MKYFYIFLVVFIALFHHSAKGQTHKIPFGKKVSPIETISSTTDNCFYILANVKEKKRSKHKGLVYKIAPTGEILTELNFDNMVYEAFDEYYDVEAGGVPFIPFEERLFEYKSHLYYFMYGVGCHANYKKCDAKTLSYVKFDKQQKEKPNFSLKEHFDYTMNLKTAIGTLMLGSYGVNNASQEWERKKLVTSPNGSKIGLIDGECLDKSGNLNCVNEELITTIVDLDDDKSYQYTIPSDEIDLDQIENYIIDDNGKIYLIGYLDATDKKEYSRQCVVYQIDVKGNKIKRLDLPWTANQGMLEATKEGRIANRVMSRSWVNGLVGPKGIAVNNAILSIDAQNNIYIFGAKTLNGWKLQGYVFNKLNIKDLSLESEQDILFSNTDMIVTENGKSVKKAKIEKKMKRFLFTDIQVNSDGKVFILFDEKDPQTLKRMAKTGFSLKGAIEEGLNSMSNNKKINPYFPKMMLMILNTKGMIEETHIMKKTKGKGDDRYSNKPSHSLELTDTHAYILSPTQYYSRKGIVADIITYDINAHKLSKFPLDYPYRTKIPKYYKNYPLLGSFYYKGHYYASLFAQIKKKQGVVIFSTEPK